MERRGSEWGSLQRVGAACFRGDLKSFRRFHPNESIPAVTGPAAPLQLLTRVELFPPTPPQSGDWLRAGRQLAFHLSALTPRLFKRFFVVLLGFFVFVFFC